MRASAASVRERVRARVGHRRMTWHVCRARVQEVGAPPIDALSSYANQEVDGRAADPGHRRPNADGGG